MYDRYLVVSDTRESFMKQSFTDDYYNDHPSMQGISHTINSLKQLGYDVSYWGGIRKLVNAIHNKTKYDNTLFINLADGLYHPNRKAQAAILLELLEVPFTGCDATSRLMSGNKSFSKSLLKETINSPQWKLFFSSDTEINTEGIRYPVVIKPNREGSSMGMDHNCLCLNSFSSQKKVRELLKLFPEVIMEEYIPGYEITCFIIGNNGEYDLCETIIITCGGISYFKNEIMGIKEKSYHLRREYPAYFFLPNQIIEKIKYNTQKAFEMLQMRDFARADFRYNPDDGVQFLEINGNPFLSPTSEIATISESTGKSYGSIVEMIIKAAEKRINHV